MFGLSAQFASMGRTISNVLWNMNISPSYGLTITGEGTFHFQTDPFSFGPLPVISQICSHRNRYFGLLYSYTSHEITVVFLVKSHFSSVQSPLLLFKWPLSAAFLSTKHERNSTHHQLVRPRSLHRALGPNLSRGNLVKITRDSALQ